MGRAMALAGQAADDGEIPVGAVVLDADGRMIGQGRNRRERDADPLAHAEVLALREAARSRRHDPKCVARQDARQRDADGTRESAEHRAPRQGTGSAHSQRQALERGWNLADYTLVVTLEPCPMCAGACLQAHVGRIVFGAWDAKLGACGSVWDIPRDPHIGHSPEVVGGVREVECAALLTDFFAARRETR